MSLQLLKYNAGIVKDTTEYSAGKNGPFYVDSDLVRFVNGYPEKIGGWEKDVFYALDSAGETTSTEAALTGIGRKMVFWRASDGVDRIAVGTHNHLYIIQNNAIYDITPLRKTTSNLSNPLVVTSGSTTITVTDSSHGASDGDWVVINSATATGGISAETINRMAGYQITYIDANSYSIQSPDAATSSATGGGTTIDIKYLIGAAEGLGTQSAAPALGWGVGGWGGDGIGGEAGTTNNGEIIIGTEIIKYTGITSNTLTGCTRGFDNQPGPGGPATTHNNGATVTLRHFGLTTTLAEALDATETEIDLTSASNFSGTNVSGFNSPAALSLSQVNLENSSWSLNIWGEDLIANVRGGRIYYWDTSGLITARAVLVSSLAGAASVPAEVRATVISFPDRHFIAAGASVYVAADGSSGTLDPMLVRWSTQEDFTKFAPTALNTAGDQRLEVGTKIVALVNTREETIISTDEAIYGMTFVGEPFIFSFRLLGTGTSAIGLNSMIAIDGNTYWMGNRSFYIYDGVINEIPCPLKHFVFDRLQTQFFDKTVAGHNVEFNEVTWFYVSDQNTAGTTNPEPDSYVTYNYNEKVWSIGSMDRTVWNDAFGSREKPFAFSPQGFLYNHETGTSDDGSAMTAFIEAAPREITAEGENLYMVDRIVPDITMSANSNLSLFMNTRKYPNASETIKGPFNITSTTEKISTRVKGRQIALKFESTGTQDEWRLGDLRIDTKMDGLR